MDTIGIARRTASLVPSFKLPNICSNHEPVLIVRFLSNSLVILTHIDVYVADVLL